VDEGGRRIAFNHIPTKTSIAIRTGVEAGSGAIRNRGLLTSVIEVWTGWKSGRGGRACKILFRRRVRNWSAAISLAQLNCRNYVAFASSSISNCRLEAC